MADIKQPLKMDKQIEVQDVVLDVSETNPSNWEISVTETGIFAKNTVTNRTFEGTQKAFSTLLRG